MLALWNDSFVFSFMSQKFMHSFCLSSYFLSQRTSRGEMSCIVAPVVYNLRVCQWTFFQLFGCFRLFLAVRNHYSPIYTHSSHTPGTKEKFPVQISDTTIVLAWGVAGNPGRRITIRDKCPGFCRGGKQQAGGLRGAVSPQVGSRGEVPGS